MRETIGCTRCAPVRRDATIQTLERIDVEALVLPVKIFTFKCLFKCTSLCIVRGDYTERNVFLLKVFSKKYNGLDLFLVLEDLHMSASRRGRRHRDAQNRSAALTNVLFPSLSSFSIPFTSINRHATVLKGTTWPASD